MLWIAYVLLALLLLLCTVGLFFFRFASVRFNKPRPEENLEDNPVWHTFADTIRQCMDEVHALPCEPLTLRAEDGLQLHAAFYPAEGERRGCVICMHGYRGTGMSDFVTILPYYHQQGYDVLLPDERACGMSEGKYITFGVLERHDCAGWAALLDARYGGGVPIYLHGISMGASTVLMTAALSLPVSVKGVIADCGFTTPGAIMDAVRRQRFPHVPAFPVMSMLNLFCRLIAHYDLWKVSTLDAVRQTKLPILFVHGEDDDFVPPAMTRENYAACANPKELLMVKGATHAVSFMTDTPQYTAAIERLFARAK